MKTIKRRRSRLAVRYEDDLSLFPTWSSKLALAAMVFLGLWLPLTLRSDFSLGILIDAGILAIGAIGLNLLTGYTGQVSLGHAFFVGVGAYCAVWFGGHEHLSLVVWLLASAVIGGVIGGIIGPFALRLRGNYLAVVSLGLVFLGLHVFHNWHQVTGGSGGTTVAAPLKLGPINFARIKLGHTIYTRDQSFLLLVVIVLGLVALLAKNVVRSRPGRAMQAVRDRDVAAEVIGVSLARYKIGAFIVSSAMAAVAGALLGAYQQFVQPDSWNLNLSIQYIAVIIIGGVGTIYGSVIGALFIAVTPQLIDRYSRHIPLVAKSASATGFHLTVFQLNQIIYGVLIVGFLIIEPLGLAAVWRRAKSYVLTWPFSY